MKCYAKGYCKGWKTERCNDLCPLYVKLNAIYSQSNIPKRYRYDIPLTPQQFDREAFIKLKEWQTNILEHVEDGDFLLIYSPTTGNGKTSWATKILNYYIRKTVVKSKVDYDVVYANVSSFLEDIKNSFDNKDVAFEVFKESVRSCNLLVLDDLGAERPTEWVRERLYELINYRYNEGKATIFTSNFTPDQIEERLGSRIGSRVKFADQVEIKGVDRRIQND